MRYALFGCLALMGCMPQPEPTAAPDTSDCGATRYADLIGEPERNHTLEAEGGVRIIPPNSAVTMDHNPMRLNVDVNVDGDIARLWCG